MVREFIFKYRSVFLIFIVLILLLIIRSFTGDHFNQGAERNALPVFTGDNIFDLSEENTSLTDALYISLDIDKADLEGIKGELVEINPESILSKESSLIISRAKGPVILISKDPTLLARAWMILAQKGVRNLFIMGIDADYESFKYQFQPDTVNVSAKPE